MFYENDLPLHLFISFLEQDSSEQSLIVRRVHTPQHMFPIQQPPQPSLGEAVGSGMACFHLFVKWIHLHFVKFWCKGNVRAMCSDSIKHMFSSAGWTASPCAHWCLCSSHNSFGSDLPAWVGDCAHHSTMHRSHDVAQICDVMVTVHCGM